MPDDPNVPRGVEVFLWRGQKRYRCPLTWESGSPCGFDTHEVEELKKHMTNAGHAREVKVELQQSSFPSFVPTLPEKDIPQGVSFAVEHEEEKEQGVKIHLPEF